jgi:RNA polymerase sigma-70 factor (ECF subfamily)
MSVDAVKKKVERMRRRFGQLLREEIAQTVLHPSEIEDELRFLRRALQS